MVKMIEVKENGHNSTPSLLQQESCGQISGRNIHCFSLESLRHWDVKMPPIKKKKRGGLMMPTIKGTVFNNPGIGKLFTKKRRITIELYKKVATAQAAQHKEQDRRVFQKLYTDASTADLSLEDDIPPLGDEDFVMFRIFKMKKTGVQGVMDWEDDDSQSTDSHSLLPNGDIENRTLTTYDVADYGDGLDPSQFASQFRERHRSRLANIEINNVGSRVVELTMGIRDEAMVRELHFENPHEVQTFVKTFQKMKELMVARGSRIAAEERVRAEKMLASVKEENLTKGKKTVRRKDTAMGGRGSMLGALGFGIKELPVEINLLVEIVSATNLPIADITTSDPYVTVEDGRHRWHKTDVVSSTLNPVWTISTGSLFLIQTNLENFFSTASFIEFIVKDYDTVGENDILGSLLINKKDMLVGEGERIEYLLNTAKYAGNPEVKLSAKKSFLTLRFKQATRDEIHFLQSYNAKKETGVMSKIRLSSGDTGVFEEDCFVPPRSHSSTNYKRNEKKASDGIAVKYRLKPFPDPSRPETETKWMTESQIETETMKPSRNWVEAGSGNVGKFYLEILSCDGLPNLDYGVRNKSDPFVCIAFEDCVVNTDVINDCLAPRWMPWTQRAFVFNISHPSSQMYIAVMDHEGIKRHHDYIGRCIVNITNARPDTMYTVRYSLYDTDEANRKILGKIKFRYRFESSAKRQFLLSALQLKEDYFVSTNSRSDCRTVHYAVTNDNDHKTLTLETIEKYFLEILDYELYFDDIINALKIVFLWRGHFPLRFSCFQKKFTFKAPFHSMIAFTWGILLSLDFDRFVSFLCFSIAWVLFGTLEAGRSDPNPWKRPRTYLDLLSMLVFNKSFVVHKIEENENVDELMAYDKQRNDIMKFRKEKIQEMRIRQEKDEIQMQKDERELDKKNNDATNLALGPSILFLSPFKDILYPVQDILFVTCVYLRYFKSVVTWRDSISAFWLATISLVLTATSFFVPWTFLFIWTFRIVAVVFLGPWMKLVDIFFVENLRGLTVAERKVRAEAEMERRYEFLMQESKLRRLIKEHKMKRRAFEKYMFGQYGVRVPIFKEERNESVPLAGGFAEPWDPSGEPEPNIVRRINGQVLKGNMIMLRQNPAKEFKARKRMMELKQVPGSITLNRKSANDEKLPLLDEKDEENDQFYDAIEKV